MGSDLSYRNIMKFGIGFTQETAKPSTPQLVYIDLLVLLYLLQAYTMCCVVTVFTLSDIESNGSQRCPALPGAWVPANAGTHAEPLCSTMIRPQFSFVLSLYMGLIRAKKAQLASITAGAPAEA